MLLLAALLTFAQITPTPIAAPAATGLEVTQLERASTPGNRILLRDLLADADEAKLPVEVLDLDLGRSPTPGFGRQIDRRFLEALAPDLRFQGANLSTVFADQVTIEQGKLLEVARAKLDEMLGDAQVDSIDVVRAPLAVNVPRGRVSRNVVARVRGLPQTKGPVTVQVDIEIDGTLARTAQVLFDLKSRATVYVLANDVRKGSVLDEKSIRKIEVEATANTPTSSDPTLLLGLVAKRDLKAGGLVKGTDFEPEIVVSRGDAVRIRFTQGTLTLETRGVARESGALGDRIRIDNLESKKALTGRVAGPGLVAVDP